MARTFSGSGWSLDEEVDGMTLQHLATVGTSENLRQCGITKLRDELKFRRLVRTIARLQPSPPTSLLLPQEQIESLQSWK